MNKCSGGNLRGRDAREIMGGNARWRNEMGTRQLKGMQGKEWEAQLLLDSWSVTRIYVEYLSEFKMTLTVVNNNNQYI